MLMVVDGRRAYSKVSVWVFHHGTDTSGSVQVPPVLATIASLRVRVLTKPSFCSI